MDRSSRIVVAHFSFGVDTTAHKTVLDSNSFAKDLESALEDRTRSLIKSLRQWQREKLAASTNAAVDGTCRGEKCSTDIPSQIEVEHRKESRPSTEQYFDSRIEFVAPGSVFADLTSVSILSALLAPFTAVSNSLEVRMKTCEGRTTNILESRCPLQSLVASKTEWWDRPPWAWTWNEIRMAHGAAIAQSMLEQLDPKYTFCNVSVSTDKCLAMLPFIHCQCDKSCYRETKGGIPVLIDPEVDDDAICRVVDEQRGRSGDGTDQVVTPHVCQKILERYCRNRYSLVNEDYTAEIDDLVRSTQGEGAQTSFTSVVSCETLHARVETPEDAETMDEVQNESAVGKVTEVERCTKARADARTETPEDAETIGEVQKESVVVKVTPEAERCTKARADASAEIPEDANTIDEAQNESVVRLAKVTPEAERCTKARAATSRRCNMSDGGFKNQPKRPRSPQIDSRGIDLTMLSQLPASIRSEARIAVALRESISIARDGQKSDARARLQHWFPRISNRCARKENSTIVIGETKKRKAAWLSASEVDPDTLLELPEDIQAMILSELSQGTRTTKKHGIASFFHSTGKRFK
jgi:hypothetical protein